MMNVDWFKLFERRNDFFVGVIYMVLMNFLRSIWFKKENVILVGIIFVFKYELKILNYFFEFVVDELNVLWKGVKVNIYKSLFIVVEI